MGRIYGWIVNRPGRFVVAYLTLLGALWAIPSFLVFRPVPWERAWDWAGVVFQFGGLLLALVGGVVALAKWHEARVQRVIDQKPIVVADCLADGSHEIRNVGSALALNVWLVVASQPEPVALGSLDAHQARILPESVVAILSQTVPREHILIAKARPGPRPYTVTFNVRATETTFRHGFDVDPPIERLTRNGTIDDYLRNEGAVLLTRLSAFVTEAGTYSPSDSRRGENSGNDEAE